MSKKNKQYIEVQKGPIYADVKNYKASKTPAEKAFEDTANAQMRRSGRTMVKSSRNGY
jgi:hypothetical protein